MSRYRLPVLVGEVVIETVVIVTLLEFVEVNSSQFFNEFSMPVYPPQSEGPANLSEVTEVEEWVWSEVTEVREWVWSEVIEVGE